MRLPRSRNFGYTPCLCDFFKESFRCLTPAIPFTDTASCMARVPSLLARRRHDCLFAVLRGVLKRPLHCLCSMRPNRSLLLNSRCRHRHIVPHACLTKSGRGTDLPRRRRPRSAARHAPTRSHTLAGLPRVHPASSRAAIDAVICGCTRLGCESCYKDQRERAGTTACDNANRQQKQPTTPEIPQPQPHAQTQLRSPKPDNLCNVYT